MFFTFDDFSILAKLWLSSGKVITQECHKLEGNQFRAWVKKVAELDGENSVQHKIAKTLKTNMRHISFLEFVSSFLSNMSKFLKHSNRPYHIVASLSARDMAKSNAWLAALVVLFGDALIDGFRRPVGIITNSTYFKKFGCDKEVDYVILDDAIFSGTQMVSNLGTIRTHCASYEGEPGNDLNAFYGKVLEIKKVLCSENPSLYPNHFNVPAEVLEKNIEFQSLKKQFFDPIVMKRTINDNLHIVCGFIGENAIHRFTSDKLWFTSVLKSLKSYLIEDYGNENLEQFEKTCNKMFEKIRRTNYIDNYPVYFDHKIPDALSSFPTLLACGEIISSKYEVINVGSLIKGCDVKANCGEKIVDGSTLDSCVPPFYKREAINADVNVQLTDKLMNKFISSYRQYVGKHM